MKVQALVWLSTIGSVFAEESSLIDSVAAEPTAEPTAVDSVAAEPTAEPTAVDSVAAEPSAVDSVAVEPTAVDSVAVEPTAVDSVAVEPTPVDSVAAEPTTAPSVATTYRHDDDDHDDDEFDGSMNDQFGNVVNEDESTAAEIALAVDAEIEARHSMDLPVLSNTSYIMCCYAGSDDCDPGGCNDPSNWCSSGQAECATCSREGAIDQGGVHRLARLVSCEPDPSSGPGPSDGPNYRGDPATMINSTVKPPSSEWPEGESPQCCWGGCGSCVDTYAYCSESPGQCETCNTNMTEDELLNASVAAFTAYTNQLPPVYHMCPGGMEVNESEVWVPEGHEYHCCWNDDCGACDVDWCSDSFDHCGQCQGVMKACPKASNSETLPPGAAIPATVEFGREWWCCWEGECGDQCSKPGTIDGDWCLESTSNCGQCAGSVTKCELPPPPMLEVGDNISENVAPDGSSWKCCIEQATCGQCYAGSVSVLNDQSWCAESIDNCHQCNGGVVACPDDRRLVDEKTIGLATTSATLSSVLLLSGIMALVH